MIYGVYAVRDAKTGFLSPTLDANNESAIRNFEHAVMRADSLFFTHPADYALYKIGDFDTDTAVINSIIPPEHLAYADALKKGE